MMKHLVVVVVSGFYVLLSSKRYSIARTGLFASCLANIYSKTFCKRSIPPRVESDPSIGSACRPIDNHVTEFFSISLELQPCLFPLRDYIHTILYRKIRNIKFYMSHYCIHFQVSNASCPPPIGARRPRPGLGYIYPI